MNFLQQVTTLVRIRFVCARKPVKRAAVRPGCVLVEVVLGHN
jgi:hypothetical protein